MLELAAWWEGNPFPDKSKNLVAIFVMAATLVLIRAFTNRGGGGGDGQ